MQTAMVSMWMDVHPVAAPVDSNSNQPQNQEQSTGVGSTQATEQARVMRLLDVDRSSGRMRSGVARGREGKMDIAPVEPS